MRPNDRHDAPASSRRKLRPVIESLETRDLPSASPLSTPPVQGQAESATIRARRSDGSDVLEQELQLAI